MHYTKPKLIQLIHIAKQKLGIDEFSYRVMLERLTGKQSTKTMSVPELMKVMHELEQKGFKKTSKRGHSPSTKKSTAKSLIASKIRALWIDMHKQGIIRDGSEQALTKWMHGIVLPMRERQGDKIIPFNVGAINDHEASVVVERLKKWRARIETTTQQEKQNEKQ
ncbi:gp16 family protein [Mannheimia massilioguelmaensis]|uniref:gp16 family protein n=1 Tax=Mannheimia massilioguelmaensis TaxID=1604354 RepID=UPI0005C8E76E|nr:regulatory protein GemA [Mannheimia massilioguelmaensis]